MTETINRTQAVTGFLPETTRRSDPAVRASSQSGDCEHRLWGDPKGLRCTRPPHGDSGHIYHDSHGSAVDDRHADGGHG